MQYNAQHPSAQSVWRRKSAGAASPSSSSTSEPGSQKRDGPSAPTWRSRRREGETPFHSSMTLGSSSSIISQGGLRQARANVGRKPTEMEMLQSPSRGIEPGQLDSSLMNPVMQDRFRQHIADKITKLDARHPPYSGSNERREELNTILLDFRKLREGLTSIRRMDQLITSEVYESSVLYAIEARNWDQVSATLPHLVLSVYPALTKGAIDQNGTSSNPRPTERTGHSLNQSFDQLTLSDSERARAHTGCTSAPADPSHFQNQAYFEGLYLLHLLCAPSSSLPTNHAPQLAAYHSALASLGLTPQDDECHEAREESRSLQLARATYAALLGSSYTAFRRLLELPLDDPDPASQSHLNRTDTKQSGSGSGSLGFDSKARTELTTVTVTRPERSILQRAIPSFRQRAHAVVQRAYKMPSDLDDWAWRARILLFDCDGDFDGKRDGNETFNDVQGGRLAKDARPAAAAAAARAKQWVAEGERNG